MPGVSHCEEQQTTQLVLLRVPYPVRECLDEAKDVLCAQCCALLVGVGVTLVAMGCMQVLAHDQRARD